MVEPRLPVLNRKSEVVGSLVELSLLSIDPAQAQPPRRQRLNESGFLARFQCLLEIPFRDIEFALGRIGLA